VDKKIFLSIYQQIDTDFQSYAASVCSVLGGNFLPGPMKTWESCSRKAKADGCEISDLKDIIRCSFIFTTEEEVMYAMNRIQSLAEVVRVKNRMTSKGYRDVLINVSFMGIVCEIQLHTALGLAAKDGKVINHPTVNTWSAKLGPFAGWGHKLYELERAASHPTVAAIIAVMGVWYYGLVRKLLS
jgi:hypothetical protein